MKKSYKLFMLVFLFFPSIINAQTTGFIENFNDNTLTGWEVPGEHKRTYTLTEADSVLKIDYHRVASSWEWDNFNFTPPLIDVSSNPVISVKVKSDVITELTFKPVYQDDSSDWLQVILSDDNNWHTVIFDLEAISSSVMNRIYMYLDGNSTTPASGTVYFDDLKIGDVADIDLTALETAIKAARALYNNSTEGTEEGQYTIGSKTDLEAAINAAQAVHDSKTSTCEDIDIAEYNLYDACVTFESGAVVQGIEIIDGLATKETKYLFSNLGLLAKTNLLFGMQDPTGYGVGWSDDDDRSDVKDVCGSYPAVSAWGTRRIALDNDVTRDRYRMTSAFARGGINTLSWHQYDPEGRGFYAEDVGNEKIVQTILPGGEYHDLYKEKLWRIARYLKSLRGSNGQSIPVVFRPYHENNGNWFWWGAAHCTREEFVSLWQFTVTYLRDSLNVHNLIYAYSPDNFDNKAEYLDRYPGDDYVDIIGHDEYLRGTITEDDIAEFVRGLRDMVELAEERNKVAALTETGRETIDVHDWFTKVLLNPIKNDPVATNISYAAVWRNSSTGHHYAPYPGHPSVPDFLKFFDDPYTMFVDDLPNVYALATVDTIAPFFTQLPDDFFTAVETTVTIEVLTNERADLRYSTVDQSYEEMELEFEEGQGGTRHSTTVTGEHGQDYFYYIRAMDCYGNKMDTSAVISFTIDTLLAPIYWTDLKYNYSSWKNGPAPLGYGSGDIVTKILPVRTAYFRHEFTVDDASSITYLANILKYDNGAVVYLNGEEVGRVNMAYGEVSYETWASEATCGIKPINLDANQISLLRNGKNVLAVEIHQNQNDNSDMLFDLRLLAPNPLIEFGANWYYYDEGQQPEVQTASTGVKVVDSKLASEFIIYQNYPNPFNPETVIKYQLNQKTKVSLEIYNVLGNKIRTLVDEKKSAGIYSVVWKANDDTGQKVASGIYFYRLQTDSFILTKKLLFLK